LGEHRGSTSRFHLVKIRISFSFGFYLLRWILILLCNYVIFYGSTISSHRNLKCTLSKVSIACYNSFDIMARTEFYKSISFHFQSFKCKFALQWESSHLLKYSCSSDNGFWLVDKNLWIDFGRTVFLQNWDMAWKIGCRLFLTRNKQLGYKLFHHDVHESLHSNN